MLATRPHADKPPMQQQVIGVSKLRAKYESHEAKRALCAAYDLFLADERVVPLLPKLLGATPDGVWPALPCMQKTPHQKSV